MSFWNHRLDQNTNEKFDSFCPGPFRAEIIKFFVGILVQTKTSKRHFEINWPLGLCTFPPQPTWPNLRQAKSDILVKLFTNSSCFFNCLKNFVFIVVYKNNSEYTYGNNRLSKSLCIYFLLSLVLFLTK